MRGGREANGRGAHKKKKKRKQTGRKRERECLTRIHSKKRLAGCVGEKKKKESVGWAKRGAAGEGQERGWGTNTTAIKRHFSMLAVKFGKYTEKTHREKRGKKGPSS